MLTFILRRLLAGVVLLFVISCLAFLLLYAGGGDIARTILGQNATAETVAQKAQELGLDQPFLAQYCDWLTTRRHRRPGPVLVHGPARHRSLSSRVAVTLSLVIGATSSPRSSSALLGVLAARRGGAVDGAVQGVSVLGFAIPGFLIAIVLVIIFALNLAGSRPPGTCSSPTRSPAGCRR